MIFNNRDNPPDLDLFIGGALIERTNVKKFLGIYSDDRVTFAEHANKISIKLSRGVGILRKMKYTAPHNVQKLLFYSYIYSIFTVIED